MRVIRGIWVLILTAAVDCHQPMEGTGSLGYNDAGPCLGKAALTPPMAPVFRRYLQDGDRTICNGAQEPACLAGACRHGLVLRQPKPMPLEAFQLCLGLMLKTVQSRNKK